MRCSCFNVNFQTFYQRNAVVNEKRQVFIEHDSMFAMNRSASIYIHV